MRKHSNSLDWCFDCKQVKGMKSNANKKTRIYLKNHFCSWFVSCFRNKIHKLLIYKWLNSCILNFAVPKFPFKVVSNIPYGITSDIFKILMFESLGNFLGGSIVLQLEPTQKLFSRKLYNPYTVFYHTFFDLKLVYEVGPESFFPPPTVKSALLNIKRKQLFFDFKFKAKYLAFISCLLEKPDLSVKTALKSIFRKSQVRSISEKFGLNLNAQIVCLSPSQWVNCFLEMLEVVPEKFHPS